MKKLNHLTAIVWAIIFLPFYTNAQRSPEQAIKSFFDGWNAGNVNKVMSMLTDDAHAYFGYGAEAAGKENIEKVVTGWLSANAEQINWETFETVPLTDDYAFWIGKGPGHSKDKSTGFVFKEDKLEMCGLLKKEKGQWKFERAVAYFRDGGSYNVQQAKINADAGKDALKVANKMTGAIAFAYGNSDVQGIQDLITEDNRFYTSSGKVNTGKKGNADYFNEMFRVHKIAVAGYATDVVQVSDKLLYMMGAYSMNFSLKKTGKNGVIQPGEFIAILEKKDGKWKFKRTISFYRGQPNNAFSIAESLTNQFIHAMNTEDANAISKMFADDIVAMHSTGQMDIGKENASKIFKSILQDRDVKETATVKDAVFLSENDLLSFGEFDLYYTSKKDGKTVNYKGEAISLAHKENGIWKLKRLIGFKRGTDTNNSNPNIAYQMPGTKDDEAMQLAKEFSAYLTFNYNAGMTDLSDWASNCEGYSVAGAHITKKNAVDYYAIIFEENALSVSLTPTEAFFIGKDALYISGFGMGNSKNKKTGETTSVPPYEYVQVMKKENGEWRLLRAFTFRRVVKPVTVEEIPN